MVKKQEKLLTDNGKETTNLDDKKKTDVSKNEDTTKINFIQDSVYTDDESLGQNNKNLNDKLKIYQNEYLHMFNNTDMKINKLHDTIEE
jgi:hypothetical protein